jgi:hypothetical protein
MRRNYDIQIQIFEKYFDSYKISEKNKIVNELRKLRNQELAEELASKNRELDKNIDYLLVIKGKIENNIPLSVEERTALGLE